MNAAEHVAFVYRNEILRRTNDEELAGAVFKILQTAGVLEDHRGDTKKWRLLSQEFSSRWEK